MRLVREFKNPLTVSAFSAGTCAFRLLQVGFQVAHLLPPVVRFARPELRIDFAVQFVLVHLIHTSALRRKALFYVNRTRQRVVAVTRGSSFGNLTTTLCTGLEWEGPQLQRTWTQSYRPYRLEKE